MLRHLVPMLSIAAVVNALSPLASAGPDTSPYSGCGLLVPGIECPRFIGDDGVTFSIPATNGFQLGDYVNVSGQICHSCPSICQEGAVFITNFISMCIEPPPTYLFDECGTLVFVVGGSVPCLAFESPSGLYFVENLGGFAPGDEVRIRTNNIVFDCPSPCGLFTACLQDNFVGVCIEPPLFIDACGRLVLVQQPQFACVVFEDEHGNQWLLENQGDFQVGDELHVSGPASFCSPLCGDVSGCIFNQPPVGCLGDINHSGGVDVADLLAVINAWGPCGIPCPADLSHDDLVGVEDLLIVINEWS